MATLPNTRPDADADAGAETARAPHRGRAGRLPPREDAPPWARALAGLGEAEIAAEASGLEEEHDLAIALARRRRGDWPRVSEIRTMISDLMHADRHFGRTDELYFLSIYWHRFAVRWRRRLEDGSLAARGSEPEPGERLEVLVELAAAMLERVDRALGVLRIPELGRTLASLDDLSRLRAAELALALFSVAGRHVEHRARLRRLADLFTDLAVRAPASSIARHLRLRASEVRFEPIGLRCPSAYTIRAPIPGAEEFELALRLDGSLEVSLAHARWRDVDLFAGASDERPFIAEIARALAGKSALVEDLIAESHRVPDASELARRLLAMARAVNGEPEGRARAIEACRVLVLEVESWPSEAQALPLGPYPSLASTLRRALAIARLPVGDRACLADIRVRLDARAAELPSRADEARGAGARGSARKRGSTREPEKPPKAAPLEDGQAPSPAVRPRRRPFRPGESAEALASDPAALRRREASATRSKAPSRAPVV